MIKFSFLLYIYKQLNFTYLSTKTFSNLPGLIKKIPSAMSHVEYPDAEHKKLTIDNYLNSHYIHRSNWLRAAVLGANDGIISISSLAIGVASAGITRESIILATVAGLVAGALSMAAGEYVSVSSQADIEKADIEREREELRHMPEAELKILCEIY